MPYIVITQPGWMQPTLASTSVVGNYVVGTSSAGTFEWNLLGWSTAPNIVMAPDWPAQHDPEAVRQRREERLREVQRETQEHDERLRRYRQACGRARNLLRSLLTEENLRRFDTGRRIRITGSAGGEYLIEHGYAGNVMRADGTHFCAHPRMTTVEGDRFPVEDAMIAQMLALITDEPAFLRVAHVNG